MDISNLVIELTTKLSDLFQKYPGLKEKMKSIHPAFGILDNPIAGTLLANATIKDASEKSGLDANALIEQIKGVISGL